MATQRLNQIQGGVTGGAPYNTATFENAKKGLLWRCMLLRFTYNCTVGSGGYTVPSAGANYAAFMLSIIKAAVGALTLSFGQSKNDEVLYTACGGQDMRDVHRFVYGRELYCSAAAGASLSAGAYALQVELRIPFETPLIADKDARKNLCGWNQMRSMQLEIEEGSALSLGTGSNTLVRSSLQNFYDLDLLGIDANGGADQWGSLLRLNKDTSEDLITTLYNGATIGIWEATAGFASTAITQISLGRYQGDEGQGYGGNTPVYVFDDEYVTDYVPPGGALIDDLNCLIYSPLLGSSYEHLLHGSPEITMQENFYNNFNYRQLYHPIISEKKVDEYGQNSASMNKSGGVTIGRGDEAASLPNQVAASTAVKVFREGTPDFLARPGTTIARAGATPQENIPEHWKGKVQAAAAAGAATDGQTADATTANAVAQLANLAPKHTARLAGKHGISEKSSIGRSSFQSKGVRLSAT